MIRYPALETCINRYEVEMIPERDMQPLTVTIVLKSGAQFAGYDPLNLDNLLARCVVEEATGGHGLPNSREPYHLPMPLQCLWRSPDGLPLWAATPFFPLGENCRDVFYWHKRQQKGEYTRTKSGRFAPRSTQGRWMERRVPLPTMVVKRLRATCTGSAAEIGRLLHDKAFIGKRRSIGFGEVDHFEIEPAEAFNLLDGNLLSRPMPWLAWKDLLPVHIVPVAQPAPVGWTPPQWKPSLFLPGWWAGTPMEIDYFEAAPDG